MKTKLKNIFYSIFKLKKAAHPPVKYPQDFTNDIIGIIEKVKDLTMTSPERIFCLIEAVRYIIKNNIEGDIVECGVWKGGSMMAIAEVLTQAKNFKKDLLLYDTFDEFSQPGPFDISFENKTGEEVLKYYAQDGTKWRAPSIDEVKQNMSTIDYPTERMKFIKGEVEKTIPLHAPNKISLLRLDTDWYQSTKHELIYLFPLLSKGGILILDDYGFWKGAKKAADEYFEEAGYSPFLMRIDDTARLIIKY